MTDVVLAGPPPGMPPGAVRRTEEQPAEAWAAPRAAVTVRALGPVEVVVADRLVNLGAPKQRALLALLASRVGQPVPVDVMLEALWAEHPPPSARTSLQAYVANLRRVLEPDRPPRTPAAVLRTCPQGYLLDSRAVDIDVQRFDERATAGWLAWDRGDAQQALSSFKAALALWRGQAYAEVADATCVAPEVARLEEMRLSVVEARCAALLAVGAHEVAVAELEAFIQAHPLREYGCELLSLALYRAGRQADALGVLRTIHRRLAEELGIDPRPALRQLEREILNHAPTLDWQPARPVAPAPVAVAAPVAAPLPSRPVAAPHAGATDPRPAADGDILIGREAELRTLGEALAAAAAGRGCVVTVSGEPGIGKTTLLQRFAETAGVPVLGGTCPEHVTPPPLWPWEQVLRAAGTCLPQLPVPGPVAELLAGNTGQPADGDGADGAGATLRRFEAIVRYLTDASRAAPLVVLLDHVHRADQSSLRLLAHLAESVPASRLLLIVSYRSSEAVSLAETLAALARLGTTRMELTGLDAREVEALAGTLLGREVGRRSAERLRDRTGGNPFFLRELLASSAGEGCPDRLHAAPVPAQVREVVLRRVARLPRPAAELLSVAAVAGRHFDIQVVADAASAEIEAALEGVDSAVVAGLLAEDEQRLGWFCFTNALVAESLYESTGRLRRARLHHRLGAAAARVWAGDTELAAETARHWSLAAELDPTAAAHASAHAAAAARAADARLDHEGATALWRQALTAADLAESDDLDRHPLLIGLGTSLYRSGNVRDGLAVFVRAMEAALVAPVAAGDPDTSRLVAAALAAVDGPDAYPVDHGQVDTRLVDVLERGLAQATDPAHRALVLSCLAVARYHDGDPAGRAALSDEALALVRSTTDDVALAHVLRLRAAALNGPDSLDRRLHELTELLTLPGLPPTLTARARRLRARVLATLGRVAEAGAELELAGRSPEEPGAPLHVQLAWSRAGLLLLGGHWREADELSRATYERHAGTRVTAEVNRAVQRWEAAYLTGGGAGLVDDLRALAESADLPALHAIWVTALIEAGQVSEARVALSRFPCGPRDHLWLYTCCWQLLAAARLGETDLVARLRAQLLPYRHLACTASDVAVSGSVAYFTAEAALALGDADAALADLAVATDATQRMGAQPWLARVREAAGRCADSRAGLVLQPGR